MNKIIDTFLTEIKSKQLKDYSISELADILEEIGVIYKYATDKEDTDILETIAKRIIAWYDILRDQKVYSGRDVFIYAREYIRKLRESKQ